MRDDFIPKDIKEALKDRFEGFELVDLLNISIEEIVETFPHVINDNMDLIEEELGLTREEDFEYDE